MSAASEYRQLASMLRAKALAGGGVVEYRFNGKSLRAESVKDLIEAAKECDRMASLLEGVRTKSAKPIKLVYRNR